jgi:hypothetical protein
MTTERRLVVASVSAVSIQAATSARLMVSPMRKVADSGSNLVTPVAE